jgi:plasmid stabilization system protein ParE
VKPVLLGPRAELDLYTAANWYEEREPGLAARFLTAVDEQLARIAAAPTGYAYAYRTLRRAKLSTFPYAIYYADQPDRIIVGTIVDARRDPRTIYNRIRRDL